MLCCSASFNPARHRGSTVFGRASGGTKVSLSHRIAATVDHAERPGERDADVGARRGRGSGTRTWERHATGGRHARVGGTRTGGRHARVGGTRTGGRRCRRRSTSRFTTDQRPGGRSALRALKARRHQRCAGRGVGANTVSARTQCRREHSVGVNTVSGGHDLSRRSCGRSGSGRRGPSRLPRALLDRPGFDSVSRVGGPVPRCRVRRMVRRGGSHRRSRSAVRSGERRRCRPC